MVTGELKPFSGGGEGKPSVKSANEVNTKGQFFRASFGKNPRFQIQLDKRPLSPGTYFKKIPSVDEVKLVTANNSTI